MRAKRPVVRTAAFALVAALSAGCARTTDTTSAAVSASVAPAAAAPSTAFASAWCHAVPLGRSFCSVVALAAPRGRLRLAVADTDARRERGLMSVTKIPPGEGMLFAFPGGDAVREFWMKDTLIPLDMIFVRADGTVTDVAARVPATVPGTPDDRIERRRGAGRYVIELGAGKAAQAGIAPGTRLAIPDIAAQ